jgi:hypothetical protein
MVEILRVIGARLAGDAKIGAGTPVSESFRTPLRPDETGSEAAVSADRMSSWHSPTGDHRTNEIADNRRCSCGTPVASRSHLPPLPQQIERLWRQHVVAVFASLGLHDADDVLRAVDIANPEPDHLARAQPRALAERHAG